MKLLTTLFVVGQCLRLLSGDPWDVPTYKILRKGTYSYLSESAIQVAGGWEFKGQRIFYIKDVQVDKVSVVPCPDIHWTK